MPGFEFIDSKEKRAVVKIFQEGGVLMAHGFDKIRKKYYVRTFEKNLSNFFKSKKSLAVSSGTAAIKIGLKALGIKPGDEVITQSFNFIATIEAIVDIGAKPIMVNVNNSLNMDPVDLKKRITKKTKAVIPVHMLGFSCQMNEIKKICKKKRIPILEDNCESIGGKYGKNFLGSIGDIGVLSLDHGKIITSGEGGVILTNKLALDKYCREYHDHGHENNPKFSRGNDTKKIYGFNYRMTEIQAAIGNEQLKKLNFIISENKKRFEILEKEIKKKFSLRELPNNSTPNYDTFIFFVKNIKKRKKILNILNNRKFGTKNLPDAIKWHCSYYWGHAINKYEKNRSLKTKNILTNAIAIPILFKKSLLDYRKITKEISTI